MLWNIDLEIQRNLTHLGAYDMLQELQSMFSKQAEQELLQTVREFHTCKQEEGQSVSTHVLKMKGYIDNLERLCQPVGKNLATVNELHAMLKLHEDTLPKKDANPALRKGKIGYAPNNAPFAPKPKIPPPPKKENPAKDAICHQCGKVGHSKGELYSFPNKSWIYDTGCGIHICITTQGLRGSKKLKPGALSLYVGNGNRAAVEAIGSYHLELPTGLDDSFINRFDENNVLSVSKNNLFYFVAVPRDGIFEIDMSCSNTNDSSMYNVSNKRAKLIWTLPTYGTVVLDIVKHENVEPKYNVNLIHKSIRMPHQWSDILISMPRNTS
ncbi:hypothetical protein Tco_0882562 [Tanacetum coccineum]